MTAYLMLAATVALTVYGQIMLRAQAMALGPSAGGDRMTYLMLMYTNPLVLSAFAGGVVASVCYAIAIERMPVTVAYPFMALTFVFTPVVAVLFLGERLAWPQLVGFTLIAAGISLTAFGPR